MKKGGKSRSRELKHLTSLKDQDINTRDIPETADWRVAEMGRFYRPLKQSVTIRLDADVLAWLRAKHAKYQTKVNSILREYMQSHR